MGMYKKINVPRFGKFNNAEYTYVLESILSLTNAIGRETLGASEAQVKAVADGVAHMTQLVAQSRAFVETAEIEAIDRQADALIVYLLQSFRTERKSPIAARASAAQALYLKTKPYIGCQTLPYAQQIQTMRGLLSDLSQTDMATHITTLGLSAVVDELTATTAMYDIKMQSRSVAQLQNYIAPAKEIRPALDEAVDDLLTIAFVTSVATPSDDTARYVDHVNKIFDDANIAYNRRIATPGTSAPSTEGEDPENGVTPEGEAPAEGTV